MKNISFDNPYLLLLLIPLLLFILVPIILAIRRENRSKSVFISLGLHILISVLAVLAAAGLMNSTVITETQVYVLADVSYSSNRNLDQIDSYIKEIEAGLPKNSKMGVVGFAKDYKVISDLDTPFVTVKDSGLDDSATEISAALNHAVELFDEGVIKRIILITDGKETHTDAAGRFLSAVENAYANGIYLDAIYLDNNLTDDVKEVQISDVSLESSTYRNHESTADILIHSTYEAHAILVPRVNGERMDSMAVTLNEGYNIVNLDLPTAATGRHDYTVSIQVSEGDGTTANNVLHFSQTVVGKLNVLLISDSEDDLAQAQRLYGADANIDAYINDPNVPCSVEELCEYDEILLSDVDIRSLNNFTAFVDGVEKVVSQFGKSLVTMGDLRIQNKTDVVLGQLEDMLPVKFGNKDQDAKLYAIVLDTSRSMQNFSRLVIAKQAAVQLLNLLDDDDYVMIVAFWGKYNVVQAPTKAADREALAKIINGVEPYQGTVIGTALENSYQMMKDWEFDEKQIMLISDGRSYTMEQDNPIEVAQKLYENGVTVSTINTAAKGGSDGEEKDDAWLRLEQIAAAGGGKCFPISRESDILDVMFSDIADDVTDSIIEGAASVSINREHDDTLEGITRLPDIMGYAYAKAKASAYTVLTTTFVKSSGNEVDVPVYAYWNYGNGRVSSFTSTFTGDWANEWQGDVGDRFFCNVLNTNVPGECIRYPYTLSIDYDGSYSEVEIIPVTLNPYATTDVTITAPDGTQTTERLNFDSKRYFYRFETPQFGRYLVDVTYGYSDKVFESRETFNLSYSPEYDCFEAFDPAPLHAAIRNRGGVYEGTIPPLENDEKEVATYIVRYTVPLMIAAVVLYVIDIIVRKLRMADIKSFFGIKPTKAPTKGGKK